MSAVFSGARAIFEIAIKGGTFTKLAYAYGVDIDEEIMHEEVQTLDALSVEEHVPVAYRVSMSAEIFRTITNDITVGTTARQNPGVDGVSGNTGSRGSLKDIGVFAKVGLRDAEALRKLPMTARIFDSYPGSGKQIAQVEGVRAVSKNFAIRARQIVGENVRFMALRVRDESELTVGA